MLKSVWVCRLASQSSTSNIQNGRGKGPQLKEPTWRLYCSVCPSSKLSWSGNLTSDDVQDKQHMIVLLCSETPPPPPTCLPKQILTLFAWQNKPSLPSPFCTKARRSEALYTMPLMANLDITPKATKTRSVGRLGSKAMRYHGSNLLYSPGK